MFIKVIVLVALIKLLLVTKNPILCAGIYTIVKFLLTLLFGTPFIAVLIGSVIAFILSLIYFWLLNRFRDTGIFWLVLILGLVIGLV